MLPLTSNQVGQRSTNFPGAVGDSKPLFATLSTCALAASAPRFEALSAWSRFIRTE